MAPTTSKMSNALCKKCNKKVFTPITCVQWSCEFHPTCAKSLNDGKPVNSSTFTCTSCKNPSTNVAGVEYQLLLNQKDEVIQVKDLLIKSKDEMIEQLRNQIEMLKQVKANSDAKSEISETTDGATSKPFKEKKEETKKEETRKEETRKEETRKEETRREDPVDKSVSCLFLLKFTVLSERIHLIPCYEIFVTCLCFMDQSIYPEMGISPIQRRGQFVTDNKDKNENSAKHT